MTWILLTEFWEFRGGKTKESEGKREYIYKESKRETVCDKQREKRKRRKRHDTKICCWTGNELAQNTAVWKRYLAKNVYLLPHIYTHNQTSQSRTQV